MNAKLNVRLLQEFFKTVFHVARVHVDHATHFGLFEFILELILPVDVQHKLFLDWINGVILSFEVLLVVGVLLIRNGHGFTPGE